MRAWAKDPDYKEILAVLPGKSSHINENMLYQHAKDPHDKQMHQNLQARAKQTQVLPLAQSFCIWTVEKVLKALGEAERDSKTKASGR